MPSIAVIGAQWGDEGKGKVIDHLAQDADFAIRWQGGANAGHSLKAGAKDLVLHLIPSAILHPEVKCLIAGGVALDILGLCEEIQMLEKRGLLKDRSRLMLADSATLVLDHHKKLDRAREARAGKAKIGTTGRGIGPAYSARINRKALIFADLFTADEILMQKLTSELEEANCLLSSLYETEPVSAKHIFKKLIKARDFLRPCRSKNSSALLYNAYQEKAYLLFEGAQGTLLDLLYGNYPYVTGCSTLAGSVGAGTGLNLPIQTLAVAKAYTTRVGEGPFPTECSNSSGGLHLQKKGREFGATTGRRRRCGWLDLPALRYALQLNGAEKLALTKLDVLSGLKEVPVCTNYQVDGQLLGTAPALPEHLAKVRPVYQKLQGWSQDLSLVRSKEELSTAPLQYIRFIERELNIKIKLVSVGPSRAETFSI